MKCDCPSPFGTVCVRPCHNETLDERGPAHLDSLGQVWRSWHVEQGVRLTVAGKPVEAWQEAQAAAVQPA